MNPLLPYNIVFHAALPAIVMRLYLRGIKAEGYRKRIHERFGFHGIEEGSYTKGKVIWFHTVSVGETIAATPLIKRVMARYPDHSVLLTCMTPTGSEQIRKSFGDAVLHCYLPYDLPWAFEKLMEQLAPCLIVVLETEIWPNFVKQANAKKIPIVLANARLSERSAKGYRRFAKLSRMIMGGFDQILVQAEADAARFRSLGVDENALTVTGSIKFDISVDQSIIAAAQAQRAQWQRPVWIAASTHYGEDQLVLAAFREIKQRLDNALLLLVPRHPERFDQVAQLIEQQGFRYVRRSTNETLTPQCEVLLGDTMGELLKLYALADVAFVGGSLVPVGGHNMLEPMALSVPVVVGPHMFNFQSISDDLVAANAMVQVASAVDLAKQVERYLNDDGLRQATVARATSVLNANRGALAQVENVIASLLKETG